MLQQPQQQSLDPNEQRGFVVHSANMTNMATAIQCQVASNIEEPVVLFGSQTAGNDATAKDALLVMCDAPNAEQSAQVAQNTAMLARIIRYSKPIGIALM